MLVYGLWPMVYGLWSLVSGPSMLSDHLACFFVALWMSRPSISDEDHNGTSPPPTRFVIKFA